MSLSKGCRGEHLFVITTRKKCHPTNKLHICLRLEGFNTLSHAVLIQERRYSELCSPGRNSFFIRLVLARPASVENRWGQSQFSCFVDKLSVSTLILTVSFVFQQSGFRWGSWHGRPRFLFGQCAKFNQRLHQHGFYMSKHFFLSPREANSQFASV